MTAITHEQWLEAQKAERAQHTMSMEEGIAHYKKSYENYAKYIGLHEVDGVCVEIGCADFPALQHYKAKYPVVIEPMPSEILKHIAGECGIKIVAHPMESLVIQDCDEIWIMNCLQHVIDPDEVVRLCKESAKIIRYFEPINTDTCVFHPHTFKLEDFERWFGKTNYYNDKLPGFHQAECAYGVWEKKEN